MVVGPTSRYFIWGVRRLKVCHGSRWVSQGFYLLDISEFFDDHDDSLACLRYLGRPRVFEFLREGPVVSNLITLECKC